MKNKYPAYRVSAPWTKEMFHYFPKSREGLEQAIEFAKENNGLVVTCIIDANCEPEIVWSNS